MSERGLLLALQRLHDDPGFVDLVSADPQNTLGIYDLDETECQTLIQAVTNRDDATLREMASKVGIDWTADHISGAGALAPSDGEGGPARRVVGPVEKQVSAFGTDWVTGQTQPTGSKHDLAQDIHTGAPIKPAGS
jgi:hypothetical protein